ncbi:ribosomal protein L7/L12 [Streptomyces sp. NPDC005386]|uniref:ribosomal protein L7/L12 n=1 Tax=Streptomyces sp. NPDC005386 TaxID=3154562 RepID=UPI0033B7D696
MTDKYFLLVCDDVAYDVVLSDPGVRVLDVLRVVRWLTGLSLWRSKVLMTDLPVVVLGDLGREAAEIAVSALRDAGARADARESPVPES